MIESKRDINFYVNNNYYMFLGIPTRNKYNQIYNICNATSTYSSIVVELRLKMFPIGRDIIRAHFREIFISMQK